MMCVTRVLVTAGKRLKSVSSLSLFSSLCHFHCVGDSREQMSAGWQLGPEMETAVRTELLLVPEIQIW